MPPPARHKHIAALDGVRGLAVLIVFVFHYGGGSHSSFRPLQIFGFVNKGGWTGVVLFFVLSGFLITGILWDSFDDPHWWRKFFARRSLRILPLYFLALVLVVLAAIPGGTVRSVLRHIWIPALFLENFPDLGSIADNLPSPFATFHLWSIAVEEQFYLLWPFLLVIQRDRRRAKLLCIVTFLVSAVFHIVVHHYAPDPGLWDHFLLTHAGGLALGGWLALSFRGPEWPRVVRLAPAAGLVGLAGFLLCGVVSHRFEMSGRYMTTLGLPLVTLFFASAVALAIAPGFIAHLFSVRWLRWVGSISYGLYVFHVLLLNVIAHVAHMLAGARGLMAANLIQFAVAATLSVLAAFLSYHLYEKQFLRLKKYFTPSPMPQRLS